MAGLAIVNAAREYIKLENDSVCHAKSIELNDERQNKLTTLWGDALAHTVKEIRDKKATAKGD
jgi:hypothetical protein